MYKRQLVKDKLLSIIPWDEINQRKNDFARERIDDPEHEMTWTDYFIQEQILLMLMR